MAAEVTLGVPRADREGSGAELRLVRPRLIRRMSSAAATGIALISGPHGSGKSTLVRSWARRSSAELIWFEGRCEDDVPEHDRLTTLLQRSAGPVVAALRGPAVLSEGVVERFAQLRRKHPALRVVLVRGLGASMAAPGARDVAPSAVITARSLGFTKTEVIQLGELVGTRIDESTAQAVMAHTGGYALGVDVLIRQLARTGELTDSVLAETTDLLTAVVADGVRDEVISSAAWERMLHTAIPDSLSVAQLGWIWDTDEPAVVLGHLEGSGLLQVTDGPGEQPRLSLVPALQAGLRRRSRLEMSQSWLRSAVVGMADWLDRDGARVEAARLLHQYGLTDELDSWVRDRWLDLPSMPIARVADLLPPLTVGHDTDPRVLLAHARILTDIFHDGHDGQVRTADLRRAEALLEAARQRLPPEGEGALRAAADGVGAMVARARGELDHARTLHRQAIALAPRRERLLQASLHAQLGLTEIGRGELAEAARSFSQAQELLPHESGLHIATLMRELERFVHGYLGTLHPSDEGEALDEQVSSALPGWVRALADASRLIAQLDVAGAWHALGRLPVATGLEDPVALLVLRAQAEAMAHLLSGTATAGLGSLDVIDALLEARVLSEVEAGILRNTRAELLVGVGEPEAALAVLEAGGPPVGLVATLVRCVVLLALDRAGDAADLVEPLLPSSSTWASNYPTWMLVVASLVLDEVGEHDRAQVLLGRGVAIASRSGAMLPFARQGTARMQELIDRAREVPLDPASRTLLDRLDSAKERMRLSSVQARLSDRELIVLQRLRETGATRRLAALLHVSPNTVKSQLQSIYRKLGASTRVEALRAATLLGLLDEEVAT